MTWQPGRKIDEPVLSAATTTSASLVATPCRVRGILVRAASSAGTLVLKDGGSSGTARITINTPAAVGDVYIPVPGSGVVFSTDVYATLTTADGVTIFYATDYNPQA